MTAPDRRLGFSWPALVGLAALAAPRVVLHDLGVIEEGTAVNALFVVVPPVVWLAAVLVRRPPRPFLTLVVVGALYGVFLAVGHQVLWDVALGGATPTLGGNLRDLAPAAQQAILRAAAAVSSLVTGTLAGVVSGAVAVLLGRVVRLRDPDRR